MRAGGQACLANVTDDLSLADRDAFFDARRESAQMGICCRENPAVFHDDEISVAILSADELNASIGNRKDARPCRRGIIDSLV